MSLIEFLEREKVTEAAIGHEMRVADASAVNFAQMFYELAISGKSVKVACQQAAISLAEADLPGAADIKLVGNGELKLTDGLPVRQRVFVSDDGMPEFGYLPDASVFFGRKEQLLEISHALADSSLVGGGVWGIGGIGKTALVLSAARRNAWRFRGVTLVDIREATQKTSNNLLGIALSRLSPGARSDDPQHTLSQFLKAYPSLIVLDNLEDLPDTELPALARFIKQIPRNGSDVLLTARVPLQAVEELSDVASITLTQGLDDWHGPHYVQYVATQKKCLALQHELRYRHGELETTIIGVEGLCVLVSQRLHGHPKMLELAVGLAMHGEKWLRDALMSLPDHLEELVLPLIETSFEAVDPVGQKLLRLLIFFPTGHLTQEAMQAVANVAFSKEIGDNGDDHIDSSLVWTSYRARPDEVSDKNPLFTTWVPDAIQQLVRAGLLDYNQSNDTYSFHQSIFDVPSDEALDNDLRSSISLGLLIHYAEYLAFNTKSDNAIDRCFENAVLLMEDFWAIRAESSPLDSILAKMSNSISAFVTHRGRWKLGEIWHERTVSLNRLSNDDDSKAKLAHDLYEQAQLLVAQGRPDDAKTLLEEALQLCEQVGHTQAIGAILQQIAGIEILKGKHGTARALLQKTIEIDESLGNQLGLSVSFFQLAVLESDQGNPDEAHRLLRHSIEIDRSFGNERGLSASLQQLATLALRQGDLSEARRLVQQAIPINEMLRDQLGLSASLHVLAHVESQQGNPSEARRLLGRLIPILESLGAESELSASFHLLSTVEKEQGNLDEAMRLLCRSIQIKERMGDQLGLSASLHQLGNLQVVTSNRAEARQSWERSVAIKQAIGDVAGLAITNLQLAELEAADGHGQRALQLAAESVQQLESLGYAQAEQGRIVLRGIVQFLANGEP